MVFFYSWFSHSASVYRQFILVQLLCCAAMLILSIFYLGLVRLTILWPNSLTLLFDEKKCSFQQWQQFNFLVTSVVVTTSLSTGNLFLYCYFGKLATDSYSKMSDCLYNMNWRKQPIKLQKYFVLMIQNIQKPVYYHGFDVATLNLETFLKVSAPVHLETIYSKQNFQRKSQINGQLF